MSPSLLTLSQFTFCALCMSLFDSSNFTFDKMQLARVTSLEAIYQITCSFLWSHKRLYTTLSTSVTLRKTFLKILKYVTLEVFPLNYCKTAWTSVCGNLIKNTTWCNNAQSALLWMLNSPISLQLIKLPKPNECSEPEDFRGLGLLGILLLGNSSLL